VDCGQEGGIGGDERRIQFTTRRSYVLSSPDDPYTPVDIFARDMNGDGRTDVVFDLWPALERRQIGVIVNHGTRELLPAQRVDVDFYGGYLCPETLTGIGTWMWWS
jgi:hypothetical protein